MNSPCFALRSHDASCLPEAADSTERRSPAASGNIASTKTGDAPSMSIPPPPLPPEKHASSYTRAVFASSSLARFS